MYRDSEWNLQDAIRLKICYECNVMKRQSTQGGQGTTAVKSGKYVLAQNQ